MRVHQFLKQAFKPKQHTTVTKVSCVCNVNVPFQLDLGHSIRYSVIYPLLHILVAGRSWSEHSQKRHVTFNLRKRHATSNSRLQQSKQHLHLRLSAPSIWQVRPRRRTSSPRRRPRRRPLLVNQPTSMHRSRRHRTPGCLRTRTSRCASS